MAQQQLAQGQVDAILSAGGSPSADLVGASGYTTEYVQALQAAYQRQLAARSGSGGSSSGSRSGSSGGGDSADYDGLFAAALESGHPKSFIANNYKKYGFTSQTGLSDEYEEWALGQEEKAGRPVENSLAMNPDSFRAFGQSIAAQLAAGGENAALGNIESRWGELSESQRAQIQQLLRRYGLEYEE